MTTIRFRTLIIAHRCNLDGPGGPDENTLAGIHKASDFGFHSEIDLWHVPNDVGIGQMGTLKLGHDRGVEQTYLTDLELWCRHLWIHCKNPTALVSLIQVFGTGSKFRFFTHDIDPYALVSDGSVWAYPGSKLYGKRYVAVLPEKTTYTLEQLADCKAVCTDYPRLYKEMVQAYASCDPSSGARKKLEADYLQFLDSIRTPQA